MQTGPPLCYICKRFFGSAATENLCSYCFKQREPNKSPAAEAKTLPLPTPVPKQTDMTRCWKCHVWIGYLGITCKCGYVFCAHHRHFIDHDCTYDYKTEGMEKIIKANPVLGVSKLNKL